MHTSSQRPATGLQRTEGRSENKMTKVHSGDGFDANQEHPESNGKPKDIEVSSKDTEERSASDSRMLECLADIAGGIQLEVGEAVLVQNLPLALARLDLHKCLRRFVGAAYPPPYTQTARTGTMATWARSSRVAIIRLCFIQTIVLVNQIQLLMRARYSFLQIMFVPSEHAV
jgi:hypothetical protein